MEDKGEVLVFESEDLDNWKPHPAPLKARGKNRIYVGMSDLFSR